MLSFFKKSDNNKPSERSAQDVFEILEDKVLVEKLTRDTEASHLSAGVIWQSFGDFKSYRARINLGGSKEIILELSWGRGESRMSLPRLYLNISTPLANFQIAEPAFVGLLIRRRYRHDHDEALAEAMKNLEAAVKQQVLKRIEVGEAAEGRKMAKRFLLDRLLS